MVFSERSRKKTDQKPLATGGRLYVHKGAVHTGAGFSSHASIEGDLISMFSDMTPTAAVWTQAEREEMMGTHAYK